jgi:hypothetical protein
MLAPMEQEPELARAQVRDFLAGRKELTIGEDGDPIKIVYRPNKVNAEYQRKIVELSNREDNGHAVGVYAICTLVSEWNITGPLVIDDPMKDADGKPIEDDYGLPTTQPKEIVSAGQTVPINSNHVRHLPTPVLLHILRAINEDMAPDPKSETTS